MSAAMGWSVMSWGGLMTMPASGASAAPRCTSRWRYCTPGWKAKGV